MVKEQLDLLSVFPSNNFKSEQVLYKKLNLPHFKRIRLKP